MSNPLVILGASREQVLLAEACRDQCHEVVMLDMFPRPERLPPWINYRQVDLLDVPKVVQAVEREGAIGVSSGFLEAPIPAMIAARQVIGVPGFPNPTAVAATMSKEQMGNIARSVGVPIPRSYSPSDVPRNETLLVKPADRGGQVGIRRATSTHEVDEAIEFARQASRTGEVIVQDWIDGTEINVVTFRGANGELQSVQSTRERLSHDLPIATKHIYSSEHHFYSATVDVYARALGERLVPTGGVLFSQFVVGSDKAWLLDCGVRLPGGLMHLIVLYSTGIDLLSAECQWASGKPWNAQAVIEPSECVHIQFLISSPGPIPSGRHVQELPAGELVGACVKSVLLFSDRLVTRQARDASDRHVAIVAAGNDCTQVAVDSGKAKLQALREVNLWKPI